MAARMFSRSTGASRSSWNSCSRQRSQVPDRPARGERGGGCDDGIGVDAVVPVELGDRAGLAEMFDAERPDPMAVDGAQPAKRRRMAVEHADDAAIARQAVLEQETGAPDLRLAQRYLGGSMGVRDSAEAAKLLWKAVGKQNATAAVLLSELYERGDGVPRSCDQARLLLVAAAKRGSPLAAQQLRNLELQGCQ